MWKQVQAAEVPQRRAAVSSKCFQLYYTCSDRLLAIVLSPCPFHLFPSYCDVFQALIYFASTMAFAITAELTVTTAISRQQRISSMRRFPFVPSVAIGCIWFHVWFLICIHTEIISDFCTELATITNGCCNGLRNISLASSLLLFCVFCDRFYSRILCYWQFHVFSKGTGDFSFDECSQRLRFLLPVSHYALILGAAVLSTANIFRENNLHSW
jgi:hypothetical protein